MHIVVFILDKSEDISQESCEWEDKNSCNGYHWIGFWEYCIKLLVFVE
jgi:hypothetical protein